MVSERTLDGLTVKMIVGVSSRCRDPAEVSGTFWNLSLICKICSSLHVLIGLQRNILYPKPNQRATPFLRQWFQSVDLTKHHRYR